MRDWEQHSSRDGPFAKDRSPGTWRKSRPKRGSINEPNQATLPATSALWKAGMNMDWQALFLTLKLDLVVCVLLLLVGVPLAFWLAFSQWRWKFLIEAIVALPLVLPPTVLGFYILLALGPHSPFGTIYERLRGH